MPIEPIDAEPVFRACKADSLALLRSFQSMQAAEAPYAVSLCVDNDVSTLYPAFNTPAELHKLIQRTEVRNAQDLARLEASRKLGGHGAKFLPAIRQRRQEDVENICRWYPGDWVFALDPSIDFRATNAALGAAGRDPVDAPEAFVARKIVLIEQLTRALAAARDALLPNSDVTVFVCIMDAERDARKIMLDAASRVNAPHNHAALARALG